jgi:hypothetical protein
MFMMDGKPYGKPESNNFTLNDEECALIPWDKCTRYIPEYWGEDGEDSDPLWPKIWVTFPSTDLSDRLLDTTKLFLNPLDPIET